MKNIIIAIFAILMMGGAVAQTAKTTAKAPAKDGKATVTATTSTAKPAAPAANVTGAEISFEKKTIDYGTLKVGDVRTVEMVYTNVGKKPLLLENVTTKEQLELLEMNRISGFVGRARGTGRPTKKERRELDDFIQPAFFGDFDFDFDDEDEDDEL